MAENVRVIVRCRPANEKEKSLGCKGVLKMKDCMVEIWDPHEGPSFSKQFTFDSVYDQQSTTESIYNDICYPLVESVLEGYNSTIFVYGQTGCGKSFTMEGDKGGAGGEKGIISRAFEHVFEAISVTSGVKYLALVSYLEIYNEQIRDLLVTNDKITNNLSLKEVTNEGVTVPGLTMVPVHNVQECEELLLVGSKNRMIGATLMNQSSSRSHSIFTISIEQMSNVNNNECVRKGKLNLVDLAGSERQSKTGATGDRLKEATKINLSLSALGNVISALVDGKARHIPYRDSKLTRLLQDSLGGNTRTLMIACVSPSSRDYVETLSTLRYANRAKNISNKPRVNEDPKDTILRKYQEEIERLRSLLENRHNSPTKPLDVTDDNSNLNTKRDQLIQEYQAEMEKLRNLHESEKSEKENVLRQIDAIKQEYQSNIEELNEQIRDKHQHQSKSKEDILLRIEELKAAMIGGEKANDKELSERRKRKKQAAERRASAIAHVLAKIEMNEDREILQNQYKDISQELDLKTDALRRYRHKVKLLEKEISDIQGEFEVEREDYLETIRKQDRQIKLLSQISEKIASTLKKECNYSDLEAIKDQSVWVDDAQKYKLPDLVVRRTKLPPAGTLSKQTHLSSGRPNDIQTAPGRLESDTESLEGDTDAGERVSSYSPDDGGRNQCETPQLVNTRKLQRSEEVDIIDSYFKPKRAAQLLNQSKLETSKVFNTWRDYARRNKNQPPEIMVNGSTTVKSPGGFWGNGDLKKPFRLEALPNVVVEKRRKERVELLQ